MTDRHHWDPQASLRVGRGDASSLVRTADVTSPPGWKKRLVALAERSPVLPSLVASVLGAVLALALVGVQHLLPPGGSGFLAVPLSTARVLLAGLAGTIVTVIAVLFWIRSSAVQLAAFEFPAHLMQRYLGDQEQRNRMAFVVGTFAYLVVTLWFMPADESGMVPQLATAGALLLVLMSIFAVISSVAASSRFMFVSEISARLAESLVEQIRGWARPVGEPVDLDAGPPPAVGQPASVTAKRSGWVRDIDEAALLAGLAPGSVVWMETRIGAFVMEGEALCTVWTPAVHTNATADEIRAAIDVGAARKLEADVDYGIQLLADAVSRSLSPGNDDMTGATEGILQLGVVMRELFVSEPPAQVRVDRERRCLVRAKDFSAEDYTTRALAHFDTEAVARSRAACGATIDVFSRLAGLARERGDERALALIRSQVVQLLNRCRRLKLPRAHVDELVHQARLCGFEDIV